VNPAPRDGVCAMHEARDGVRLRYARWLANRSPVRGTVVIHPGRAEFIEKYFETVNDLRRRGFAVFAYDPRGQGGSDRVIGSPRKGHVRDAADYVNDLEMILQELILPDCPPPYYLLGHSMGALVALLAAARLRSQIERMVLVSPLLGLPRLSAARLAQMTSMLMQFGLGEAFVPGGGATIVQTLPFEGNPVTSDRRRYERTLAVIEAAPSLGLGAPTIGWINAIARALVRTAAADFGDAVPVPVLMLLAGAETVVSNQAAENFSRRVKTVAHLRVPASRHEILMEADEVRDQFWTAFDAFVRGRG
jgi:lysophospholipase